MRKWTLIVLVVFILPSFAGIRENRRTPNRLEIDGASYGRGWIVSSPTLHSPDGYLVYDATGKSPKVSVGGTKGPQATWTFVGEKRYHEELANRGRTPGTDSERRGWSMKLRAAAGPFAGWYLGHKDGSLILVKDPARAATVALVGKECDIIHK